MARNQLRSKLSAPHCVYDRPFNPRQLKSWNWAFPSRHIQIQAPSTQPKQSETILFCFSFSKPAGPLRRQKVSFTPALNERGVSQSAFEKRTWSAVVVSENFPDVAARVWCEVPSTSWWEEACFAVSSFPLSVATGKLLLPGETQLVAVAINIPPNRAAGEPVINPRWEGGYNRAKCIVIVGTRAAVRSCSDLAPLFAGDEDDGRREGNESVEGEELHIERRCR